MKKFTKIIICLMLCFVSMSMFACDKRTEKEKNFDYPTTSDVVFGNGGLSVQMGNHLFFVNGFKDISSSSEYERNKSYSHGSLMLANLKDDGSIYANDDGSLDEENYIIFSDKLCGFNVSGLFVSGEYLYFSTPCQEATGKEGKADFEWQREYVEFYRVKLDKTSKPEKMYQTDYSYTNMDFKFFSNGNRTCVVICKDGNNLYAKDLDSKDTIFDFYDVKSFVFPENGENLFYVQEKTENNKTKRVLNRVDVYTGATETFKTTDSTSELEVKLSNDKYVFASYKTNSYTNLYRFGFDKQEKSIMSFDSNKKNLTLVDENTIIFSSGNKFKFAKDKLLFDTVFEDAEAESVTIIGTTDGSVVYYDNNNKLKMFSYSNVLAGQDAKMETLTTLDSTSDMGELDTYFDMNDGRYLYFFKNVKNENNSDSTGHYYLHRIKIKNRIDEKEELIGVYESADAPTVDEEK